MAAKKAHDSTIILFDVGRNTKEYDESKSQTFYEQAKNCLQAILMQKIFTKPTDELALFLIGSKTTANPLNTETQDGYSNISQAFELKPMNWSMLKFVQNDIESPNENSTGDWLDAIIVAMDYFNRLELVNCTKKILLFTTFSTEVDSSNFDDVIKSLEQMEVELFVVTKNVINELNEHNQNEIATFSQSMEKDQIKAKSEALIMDIVRQSNGMLCSLDEAVAKLIYVDKKQRRRMPWNCDLTFGTTFTIKIAAYIYLRDEPELDTWKMRTAKGEECKSRIEHYHNSTLVDPETVNTELVKGYMYGDVPVAYEDAFFDNGGKGLRCIGFTKASRIPTVDFEGSSIWVVVPQKGYDSSAKRLSALIAAMHNQDLALIARYTYRNGTAPKLMALFSSDNSLHMHELFFKDNMVTLTFPPLDSRKFTPSTEQYEFMDKFIDAMDLMKDASSSKRFDSLTDPGLQHLYRVIAHRALNPKDRIPKIDDDLLALITPPTPHDIDIAEMKKLFPTEPIKLTNKEKLLRNIQNIQNDEIDEDALVANLKANHDSEITKIGTIRPTDDFMELFYRGERFNTLVVQMQDVIVQLATKSMIAMDDKIKEALAAYRETAKQKGPFLYNDWIVNFKKLLEERERVQLWEMIVREQLGLITASESEISTVTAEEAATFYKSDDFYTQMNQRFDYDMDDADDLLNEM